MFEIVRADTLKKDPREQMSVIFADGFTQWLEFFSKDKNKIAKAFAHMFVLDQFYVAVAGDEIAGIASCTDCKTLAVRLNANALRKHLGLIKGTIARFVLKKEFEQLRDHPPVDTGSIGFVGTHSKYQGQGVASQIIRHILENTHYHTYMIEEVADTNLAAMNLYQKLGFQEYKRTPVSPKLAKKIGINSFIALKYECKDVLAAG